MQFCAVYRPVCTRGTQPSNDIHPLHYVHRFHCKDSVCQCHLFIDSYKDNLRRLPHSPLKTMAEAAPARANKGVKSGELICNVCSAQNITYTCQHMRSEHTNTAKLYMEYYGHFGLQKASLSNDRCSYVYPSWYYRKPLYKEYIDQREPPQWGHFLWVSFREISQKLYVYRCIYLPQA